MTGSVTLAGLPRAGASSKPHRLKQNVQKYSDLSKTWVLRGKQFTDFRQKNETFISTFQKTQWKTRTLNASFEQGRREQ